MGGDRDPLRKNWYDDEFKKGLVKRKDSERLLHRLKGEHLGNLTESGKEEGLAGGDEKGGGRHGQARDERSSLKFLGTLENLVHWGEKKKSDRDTWSNRSKNLEGPDP